MVVADRFIIGLISLPDFTVSGSLGTSIETVDKGSGFIIVQDTENISITSIATPLKNIPGQTIEIINSNASSTSINILENDLPIGTAIHFKWTGDNWVPYINPIPANVPKIFTTQITLTDAVNLITHSFNLAPPYKSLEVFVRDDSDNGVRSFVLSTYSANKVNIDVSSLIAGPPVTYLANILIIGR